MLDFMMMLFQFEFGLVWGDAASIFWISEGAIIIVDETIKFVSLLHPLTTSKSILKLFLLHSWKRHTPLGYFSLVKVVMMLFMMLMFLMSSRFSDRDIFNFEVAR